MWLKEEHKHIFIQEEIHLRKKEDSIQNVLKMTDKENLQAPPNSPVAAVFAAPPPNKVEPPVVVPPNSPVDCVDVPKPPEKPTNFSPHINNKRDFLSPRLFLRKKHNSCSHWQVFLHQTQSLMLVCRRDCSC